MNGSGNMLHHLTIRGNTGDEEIPGTYHVFLSSIAPNPGHDKWTCPFVGRGVRREEREGKAAKAKGERRKGLKPGDE
jgi:hypothetical protein